MKRFLLILTILAVSTVAFCQKISYQVDKIWGGESYCAFTSLIKYKGNYYCSFREGESHIFDSQGNAEGKTRVIVSKNGKKWKSAFICGKKGCDLRDPKLSVMPDGRLMVIMGGSVYRNRELKSSRSHVCFSNDGKHFTEPQPVIFNDNETHLYDWLWRVTWHEGTGYSVDYGTDAEGKRFLGLYTTRDGITYNKVTDLHLDNFPNETTIRFLPDGRMSMMVRCEQGDGMGVWGISEAPYTEWKWTKMALRLGGQDYLVDGNNIIMSSRNYYLPYAKTAIYKGNFDGKMEEMIVLPSGGDCSYPGLLLVDDELWASYYSSHEGKKASIYLARIPLKSLGVEKHE